MKRISFTYHPPDDNIPLLNPHITLHPPTPYYRIPHRPITATRDYTFIMVSERGRPPATPLSLYNMQNLLDHLLDHAWPLFNNPIPDSRRNTNTTTNLHPHILKDVQDETNNPIPTPM
eukprot:GHVP01001095.1.p1 GENE.GHVP01001095.1~~GHVP01001095.1.p1  ORF type:complete len:118 (-),score=6.64 GHVP01001095.1:1840-2193(-)